MARNGLFARALLVALLMIQFAAVPVFAQQYAAEAEATEEEGGLNYDGIMNTSDSLAWSTSDSLDEMVVDGETGYLVAAGDEDSFLARLQELSDDESLRGMMGAAGRRRVEGFRNQHRAGRGDGTSRATGRGFF